MPRRQTTAEKPPTTADQEPEDQETQQPTLTNNAFKIRLVGSPLNCKPNSSYQATLKI